MGTIRPSSIKWRGLAAVGEREETIVGVGLALAMLLKGHLQNLILLHLITPVAVRDKLTSFSRSGSFYHPALWKRGRHIRLPPPMGDDAGGCVVMAIAFFPHPANDNVLYVRGRRRRRRRVDRTRETNCSPVYSIETSGRGRMIVKRRTRMGHGHAFCTHFN